MRKKRKPKRPMPPMGAGSHLHQIIVTWFKQNFSPTCTCRETVEAMDKNVPQWSIDHMDEIVAKIRVELQNLGWFGKLADKLPVRRPLRKLIRMAVERAEADLVRVAEEANLAVAAKIADSLQEFRS